MSWFSKYVGDPLKALLVKAEQAAETELHTLAGDVAKTLPAAPVTAAVEVQFETDLQAAVDTAISAAVGPVPGVGSTLAPEAVAAANAAIDYLVQKGGASLNALAAQAKATLAAYAAGGAAPSSAAPSPGA